MAPGCSHNRQSHAQRMTPVGRPKGNQRHHHGGRCTQWLEPCLDEQPAATGERQRDDALCQPKQNPTNPGLESKAWLLVLCSQYLPTVGDDQDEAGLARTAASDVDSAKCD
eukprot:CAMPEP_0184440406 /NCGR_PEP_ID=MMETSP0738-20130409/755547_1 /TAXON_ID=385413 /ORGANISM="Thalassiosira miniscula, Strain CCMP1093" /LENGTH=110 /DNA_ID=CAMNT_0026808291 /DNA_START=727 /DNA_END=1056 /DNA_ORIENTATION=+